MPATPSATAQSDRGTVIAPTISLPKGGGAIRGLGEKFTTNPVNGSASLSVPIATSPGRCRFGPQLALTYDSAGGNGPFGMGWSLSLPSIARKTEHGLPRYRGADESDVFILSGAEDLVPLLDRQGHRVVDQDTVPGFAIHYYRPRIEGLFASIERWTRLFDGDTHWRTITRDNVATIYGRAVDRSLDPHPELADPRIADPADPSRIFSWLICDSRDDKGNAVVYEYKCDDGARIDVAQACERNRGDATDPRRQANRYLKRICYGNRVSLLDAAGNRPRALTEAQSQAAGWMFEIVLDYGEHDAATPTPAEARAWDCRPDAFSSYRAGFEVRTSRLCRRVLMFHHFEADPTVGRDCLVRSTDLGYAGGDTPEEPDAAPFAFLTTIGETRYQRSGAGYDRRSLPPLGFEYTRAVVQDAVFDVNPDFLENLPIGVDGTSWQWTDLHGEGIPGILTEQAGAWLYKRNVTPISGAGVEFAPLEIVAKRPNLSMTAGQARLMDLAGDGLLDLVVLDGPQPGFHEHDGDEGWLPFRAFPSRLNRPIVDPNARLVDVDGDGHADVLITEDEALVWHESLGEEGFGPAQRVAQSRDDELGPRLVFANADESIYLADMSGDGLTDLVRVRNAEVCYWPNLGYAVFGAKVTMDNAPCFDRPNAFSQRRIRLADVDGSGTTDIVYLHDDGVRLYFNRSGNSWSGAKTLRVQPRVDDVVSIAVTDLLGNGTACLVWSSPLPADATRQMRYVDLMGGKKPHLLAAVVNNLGVETRVQYAPSTKFYLRDRRGGNPWITKLPFPVHVVEKVTVSDKWRRTRFSSTYSYRHGYFDGVEREFRGFGRIDQVDVESFGESAALNVASPYVTDEKALFQPPVRTTTWYHTGAFLDRERLLTQFEHEYFPHWLDAHGGAVAGAFREKPLPQPDLDAQGLDTDEWREALRACKGMMLRQEIVELDLDALERTDGPKEIPVRLFSAAQHNCHIRRLQPRGPNRHAVFLVGESESLTYHHELDLRAQRLDADPRIAHTLNLRHDDHGNVLQSVAIGYPRLGRFESDAALSDGLADALALIGRVQRDETHVAYSETRYTDDFGGRPQDHAAAFDNRRLRVPAEVITCELTAIAGDDVEAAPGASAVRYFSLQQLRALRLSAVHQSSGLAVAEIAYHQLPNQVDVQRRVVEHVRTLFFAESLADPLPLGQLGRFGLAFETYTLALTSALLDGVFRPDGTGKLDVIVDGARTARQRLDDASSSGYLSGAALAARFSTVPPQQLAGQYWIRSGVAGFAADAAHHFHLPERYADAFGNVTTLQYDENDLFIEASSDALGNTTAVTRFDFRILAPREIRDANGNLSEVRYDILGLPTATAVKGKGDEGDDVAGFTDAIVNPDRAQLVAFFTGDAYDDAQARTWIGNATTRHVYYFGETVENATTVWATHPACACAIARERHVRDLAPGEQSPIQSAFEYSDGAGSVIVRKSQAEPEAPGRPLRWVANGRTIINNKGNPVRQYEPYFASPESGHRFEEPREEGVARVVYYDAVSRAMRTELPDGSYSRVEFSPWHVRTFDPNDTVNEPANAWLAAKSSAAAAADERRAAQLAVMHAGTPSLSILDGLGRETIAVAHNRVTSAAGVAVDKKHFTFTRLDAEGKPLWTRDARGNLAVQCIAPPVPAHRQPDPATGFVPCYDVAGNLLFQRSNDGGDRWALNDAAGKPMLAWDGKGRAFCTDYDALHRPSASFVVSADSLDAGRVINYEKTVYGDTPGSGLTAAQSMQLNLRGRPLRHHDTAGIVTSMGRNPVTGADEAFDFKGNALRSTRQFVADYKSVPDWSANPALVTETFANATRYDALDRAVQLIAPHSDRAGATLNVIRPAYNESNLLARLDVWLEQASEAGPLLEPVTATVNAVTDIDYDAKGQRRRIVCNEAGHRIVSEYTYDDATFRLLRLVTTRPSEAADRRTLQDLTYSYDAVGNIMAIRDDAQQPVIFDNCLVLPGNVYEYDALYRLTRAEGREHAAQCSIQHDDRPFDPVIGIPFPNSPEALQRYVQTFEYDAVGNILALHHRGGGAERWVRWYQYALDSNRLLATSSSLDNAKLAFYAAAPGYVAKYGHDAHGNMTAMPHLPVMQWDFRDRLQATQRQIVNDGGGSPETTYYVYDGGGQRLRKITETHNGVPKDERIYLGASETFRKYGANAGQAPAVRLERETLHILDGTRRIALIETRTRLQGVDPAPRRLVRFQFGDHLGSAATEVDHEARVISYEEFHPYGTTAYEAARSTVDTPRRYRYSGRERDEETGLGYHGARYCAYWLGRWTSCDPVPRIGLYVYCANNPIALHDPGGMQEQRPPEMYQAQVTGQETPEQVRKMFAAKSIFYRGEATWVTTHGGSAYWHLETWQVIARDTGKQLNMRADQIKGPPKPKAAPPKPTGPSPIERIRAKREQDWQAAKAGMWDTAVDTLFSMATMSTPHMRPLSDYVASKLKSGAPQKTGDYARDVELKEHYEGGGMVTHAVVLAAPFVPVGEIAQGARLALSKAPALVGAGGLGGGELVTFSEQWAAEARSLTEATAHTGPESRVYQLVDEQGEAWRIGETVDVRARLNAHANEFGRSFRGMQIISEPMPLPQARALEGSLGEATGTATLSRESSSMYKLGGGWVPEVEGISGAGGYQPPTYTILNPAYYPWARGLPW